MTALPRTVENSRAFARNLHRLRERVGITAEQLDDLAGLDRGSVERFELTQQRAPAGTVLDLAAALRVPASELLRSAPSLAGAS